MTDTPQPLDLGPEPTTVHGFARDIWRMSHAMQQDLRELHGRIDAIAGNTNGTASDPASLAGVYASQKELRRDLDEHTRDHEKSGGRWWTVSMAGFAALLGAFAKEVIARR